MNAAEFPSSAWHVENQSWRVFNLSEFCKSLPLLGRILNTDIRFPPNTVPSNTSYPAYLLWAAIRNIMTTFSLLRRLASEPNAVVHTSRLSVKTWPETINITGDSHRSGQNFYQGKAAKPKEPTTIFSAKTSFRNICLQTVNIVTAHSAQPSWDGVFRIFLDRSNDLIVSKQSQPSFVIINLIPLTFKLILWRKVK